MTRKDYLLTIAVAIGAGCLGGLCSGVIFWKASGIAQQNAKSVGNVRAERFELIDKTGTVRGGFFIKEDGYPVLSVGYLEEDFIRLNLEKKGPSLILSKPSESLHHRDIVLRVSDSASGISFYQGDSGIDLYANDQAAHLNISSHKPGLTLEGPFNSPTFPSTDLSGDSGGASLSFYDAEGIRRTVLGSAVMKNPKSGFEAYHPLPSLIFFKKDGTVKWKAP
jgi:hypothetical protein